MADGGIAAGLCVTVFAVSFWEASTGKGRAICNHMMQAAFLVWAGVQLQTMPVEKKTKAGRKSCGWVPYPSWHLLIKLPKTSVQSSGWGENTASYSTSQNTLSQQHSFVNTCWTHFIVPCWALGIKDGQVLIKTLSSEYPCSEKDVPGFEELGLQRRGTAFA